MRKYQQETTGPICVHCRAEITDKQPTIRYPRSKQPAHFRCAPLSDEQRREMDGLLVRTR